MPRNKKKGGAKGSPSTSTSSLPETSSQKKKSSNQSVASAISEGTKDASSEYRSVTGVIACDKQSRDVHVENFSLLIQGVELVKESRIELNYGKRYGLIGFNGCGKSTLLKVISQREIPYPERIDCYHLEGEVPSSSRTALQCVIDEVEELRKKLEKEAEDLVLENPEDEGLDDIYERLDSLEVETAESRAAVILHGLGFTKAMQNKAAADFSGGWRMRIALAKALFIQPTLLLLDEPTNHLDINACVWLEEYLKEYTKGILVLISHSQDFMNEVCTDIIHLHNKDLKYYGGNYDTYVEVRAQQEEHQMKQYQGEQDRISAYKDFIARFGHGTKKMARQAKSREKAMTRMSEGGLTAKVVEDRVQSFYFPPCEDIPPPVLQFNKVDFAYGIAPFSKKAKIKSNLLFTELDLGIDLDSRISLVGPNGAGKSTLLKLMMNELIPVNGEVRKHPKLRVGWFHQHLSEKLPSELTPLEYMCKEFPNVDGDTVQTMRSALGRYGITGAVQSTRIAILSDGQRSRVCFAWLAFKNPQLLLLDEPTNHLDMETIDVLAEAINEFEGGVVLVSHDFRLIMQVTEEIWEVENHTVTKWKGDIIEYKRAMKERILNNK